jgi:nucleotide sugar dehydrogenase
MNYSYEKLTVVARQDESIDLVVRRISDSSKVVAHPGLAVVLDKNNVLLGVVTDSDIRRACASNMPFSHPISEIMIKNPITVLANTADDQVISEVMRKIQMDSRHESLWVRHILVTDNNNKLIDIVDFIDAIQQTNSSVTKVAIFGMGYVGLTLSVSLANRGHQVVGVDIDENLIKRLNSGESHVHEPGLNHMMNFNLNRQKIKFSQTLNQDMSQVYIVAVGTPLDSDSKPELEALNSVLEVIATKLKSGDQVVLRSTVPVGTTRDIVVPYLEFNSGLQAGEDFFVSFAPERTIEGAAMVEVKTLPQIIGGYSSKCLKKGVEFWSTLTSTVVRMDSLEAAELVKLANNTFRDVSFAFANELALLADKYNANAFTLINGANEGYPRNKIPLPSPGVGGYCLTKDPVLFSSTSKGMREDAVMGLSSRKINERAMLYPIELLKKYAFKKGKKFSELVVLIMGVAFKGVPETTDIRGSISIDIMKILINQVKKVYGWDAVIDASELQKYGFYTAESLANLVNQSDVILILNNHPSNVQLEIFETSDSDRLIFDGWNQLDMIEVEKVENLEYATMGYMTQ